MAKDPYKLLGVSKSATEKEIKSAYRKLAKKLHPDVNKDNPKAEAEFKEISAAYTLLSDAKLRKQFDTGQVDGSGQAQNPFGGGGNPFAGGRNPFGSGPNPFGGPGGADDLSSMFSSLFGMNMGGQTGGPQRRGYQQTRARPQKGSDIRYKLTLDFLDALGGGSKRIKMSNGQMLDLKIPKGTQSGQTLRLKGKGHPSPNGGPAGDAKVDITVKTHKYFTLDGKHVRLTLPITLQEAVLGGKVKIPMPSGAVSLNIPAGTNSGKTLRLKGKGVNGGDLLVTPQIILDDPKSKTLKDWAEANPASSGVDPRNVLT